MTLSRTSRPLYPMLLSGILLLSGAPAHCFASAYQVTPVSMTLKTDVPEGEFRLMNQESHAVRVQVDVQLWSQHDNNNVQIPTADFIVSPRFADIPAHGSQVVRIALRRFPSAPSEASYRVMFREIPRLPFGVDKTGVALNYSVPLFVLPGAAAGSRLTWTARQANASTLVIAVSNAGGSHAKLEFKSVSKGQNRIPLPGDNSQWRYVLAGVTREMHLTSPVPLARGEKVSVSLDINGKPQELSLSID